MSELEHWQDRLTVASQVLVESYADLRVRGYDKEPNLVAAALDDVESVIRQLRAAKFGAEGSVAHGRVELIRAAEDFGNHTCSCDYCLHSGVAIGDEGNTFTVG